MWQPNVLQTSQQIDFVHRSQPAESMKRESNCQQQHSKEKLGGKNQSHHGSMRETH